MPYAGDALVSLEMMAARQTSNKEQCLRKTFEAKRDRTGSRVISRNSKLEEGGIEKC